MKVITTCEHGGNLIPEQFAGYFTNASKDLNSHLGIDFGALDIFHMLSENYSDFSKYSEVSRLLVDLNRSPGSQSLFSKYTSSLPENFRKHILAEYYYPFRESVVKKVKEYLHAGEIVIHISVHTFTPVLNDEVRMNDIGLLYDPGRSLESRICVFWKEAVERSSNDLRVMFNHPYPGTSDGLTKYLREIFDQNYAGIELEINQKHHSHNKMNKQIKETISASFLHCLEMLTKNLV